ncbi:hypothetical protein D3C86_2133180 [compost metagenome]
MHEQKQGCCTVLQQPLERKLAELGFDRLDQLRVIRRHAGREAGHDLALAIDQ